MDQHFLEDKRVRKWVSVEGFADVTAIGGDVEWDCRGGARRNGDGNYRNQWWRRSTFTVTRHS